MTRLSTPDTMTPSRGGSRKALGSIDVNSLLSTQFSKLRLKTTSDVGIITKPIIETNEINKEKEENIGHHNMTSNEDDFEEDKASQLFRYVCLNRCAEDFNGEMAEGGIEEWSIEDFDYVRPLGNGGTASVFEARERQSGYHVALKVQKATEDAIWEVDIHETLDHPCIVKMIDYFYSENRFGPELEDEEDEDHIEEEDDEEIDGGPKRYLILILELCEKSLFDVIRDSESRCISEQLAAAYFSDILDSIQYLHGDDIIHCDCKTLNFLVSKSGEQVKLADFGMAVRAEEKEIVGGSPIYMAPEHLLAWRHMTDNFDHTSDIYSLGIVLFEMLAGYLPYEVIQKDGDSVLVRELNKDEDFEHPVLDLRRLDDHTAEGTFNTPPIIFPDCMSEEAQDLILRLTSPLPENRITVEGAKEHPWLQKFGI